MMQQPSQLADIHRTLIRATQMWALRDPAALERARPLRHQAILMNHAHYLAHIPVYRQIAAQEGIDQVDGLEPIRRSLMLPDEIFKSYDQRWLDEHNFTRMNGWLSEIFYRRVDVDVRDITSIDDWIERLGAHGVRLVYSSGTSGTFSFVPRDPGTWGTFVTASTSYLAPLLMHSKVGTWFQRALVLTAARFVQPETFTALSRSLRVRDYDAIFLDFSSGHTGNQTLEQQLAPLFRQHHYLYDFKLSPTVLRLTTRPPRNEDEQEQLLRLQDLVINRRDENYRRVIAHMQQSTRDGQKIFIFGTTQQYLELCQSVGEMGEPLHLRPGGLAFFGGGWKSFTGEKLSRDVLVATIAENLHLPEDRILEGYSMTEINAFMLRCDHGRFHIPPTIEPVIFDEALVPQLGSDLRGVIGFLDPFARAYPGFIISGDEVRYVEGDCPCGLNGPAVTEIGRARSREVKGCGGIMASLKA